MVDLEPHDPVWFERFERQRARLRRLAPDPLLAVFHVGSTAVPDLVAKPALDVLVVFPGYEGAAELAARLDGAEFEWKRDDPDWLLCSRGVEHGYRVHVHLRPRDVQAWRDQVVFREFLREDASARAEYERTKRRAAREHAGDEGAYTDAKAETVLDLLERAREAGYGDRVPDL